MPPYLHMSLYRCRRLSYNWEVDYRCLQRYGPRASNPLGREGPSCWNVGGMSTHHYHSWSIDNDCCHLFVPADHCCWHQVLRVHCLNYYHHVDCTDQGWMKILPRMRDFSSPIWFQKSSYENISHQATPTCFESMTTWG